MEPKSPFAEFAQRAVAGLEDVADADKALKIAARLARETFRADAVCVARREPGTSRLKPVVRAPSGERWQLDLLARFLGERRPKMPPGRLIAPIRRRGRDWGVLALRRQGTEFEREDRRDVTRVAEHVSRLLCDLDQARVAEVRERIDRKVLEMLRPKDLFYQILHGLHSLTRYDHSAAVLIQRETSAPLELVAERITWRKGKSQRVGLERELTAEAREVLERGEVVGFDRRGGRWHEWRGRALEAIAEALDYNGGDGEERDRREMTLLCAPLATREGLVGALKVAACHPGTLGRFEAELVQRFLPQAAVAIRNLERTVTLESRMLAAERKHALAGLARGVSHDVNNAFGSVLPLVQQMIVDARAGRVEPEVLIEDLEQIEASVQACRRIFGGMLTFAKGAAGASTGGDVGRALENVLAVLGETMRRHAVQLDVAALPRLPSVRGKQSDLEQLLLNLATNARDAMPSGGTLAIRATSEAEDVCIEVSDTGCGIPDEHLERLVEPFFTTKRDGSGLGLSICRSIVWNMGGRMSFQSELGRGTRVTLRLPTAAATREEVRT